MKRGERYTLPGGVYDRSSKRVRHPRVGDVINIFPARGITAMVILTGGVKRTYDVVVE